MSDSEALKLFSRQPVSREMVDFLAATTALVIQVKKTRRGASQMGDMLVTPVVDIVPLDRFIQRLIEYSNVQTPTLMASLVYLNRMRNALPGNAVGMESTRHRIFLAALILSAKSLNDLSPLNKHWTKYTDGLMSQADVNSAERELIGLLKWNLTVSQDELVAVLQPFLARVKADLRAKLQLEARAKLDYYRLSCFNSNNSLASASSSKLSIFSSYSLRSAASSASLAELARTPLREKSSAALNMDKDRLDKLDRLNMDKLAMDHVHLAPPARVR